MNMFKLLSWKNIIYVIIPEIPTGISGIMNCHMFYRLCYWKTAFSESYMYDVIKCYIARCYHVNYTLYKQRFNKIFKEHANNVVMQRCLYVYS